MMATMNFLKRITERAAVNESLYPLLFGELLEDTYYWYCVDGDLTRQAQGVLRLYFGLIQAYCFALAQSHDETLAELELPDKLLGKIKKVWNVEKKSAISSMGELFSYFSVSTQSGVAAIFTDAANLYVKKIHRAFTELSGNSRADLTLISREDFLDFLDSLPLLKTTSFSKETLQLTFHLPNETLSIKASPFISFLSFDKSPVGEAVDSFRNSCYVLVSVSEGDAKNELIFDTMRISERHDAQDQCRLCRRVDSNENLALLCDTANLKTSFYSTDDCLCDLKFLNVMVEATQIVLADYLGIKDLYHQNQNIKNRLLGILEDTEKYRAVLEVQETVKFSQLNDILFDLFLTEGLFKTVLCIVHNRNGDRSATSLKMFLRYLDALTSMGVISKSEVPSIIAMCDEKIADASKRLDKIISKDSPGLQRAYQKRVDEIQAEWRTFYILHAAGIKKDNLFADVETILSIDDYYDMIGNEATTLEYDLMRVLRTLCVFYGTLLKLSTPFDEKKFFKYARRVVRDYNLADHTLETLFDALIRIANACETSKNIEEMLGRKQLGDSAPKCLEYFKENLLGRRKDCFMGVEDTNGTTSSCDIFISYAHEDVKKVKPVVTALTNMGLRVFFDETDIHISDDWIEIAEKAMEQDRCKMVVSFFSRNSVGKKAVRHEIEHADLWRKNKYPDDEGKQRRFLVVVNLEDDLVGDYLPDVAHKDANFERRKHARKIADCVSTESIFIKNTDHIAAKVQEVYDELSDSDGKVIPRQELDAYKLEIANLYAYFKTGDPQHKSVEDLQKLFNETELDSAKCIFPIVASVKESKIKRDNIAIVGYELIRGKGRGKPHSSQILTSRTLEITDYYCIPKYRNSHEFKRWMVEPLLIRCDRFVEILSEGMINNNESKVNG